MSPVVHFPLAVASSDLCSLLLDVRDGNVDNDAKEAVDLIMVCAKLGKLLAPVQMSLSVALAGLNAALQAAEMTNPVNVTLVAILQKVI